MILTVVFYLFVVFTGIQILYYLSFSTFLFTSKTKKNTAQIPVSVIVFVKNNEKELAENLPFIINQNYNEFEVVLVNAASTDNSLEVMETFKEKNRNIKLIDVENNEAFWANKKYALTLAIKGAKHEHLIFTEANCKPISEHWIAEMSEKFSTRKTIVLGFKKFEKKVSFANLLIRFDNFIKAVLCFSFAKNGIPFSAFGSNFGYQKSEFFKVKGFINHIKIRNGEDDLFIRDAANKKNISYTIAANSIIENNSPQSFKKWYQEKKNAVLVKNQFKFKHRFLINLFTFSKFIFYCLTILLLFLYPWKIIAVILGVYFLIQFIVLGISANKFKEPYLILFLPFLEITLLLLQISIFISNFISKPKY